MRWRGSSRVVGRAAALCGALRGASAGTPPPPGIWAAESIPCSGRCAYPARLHHGLGIVCPGNAPPTFDNVARLHYSEQGQELTARVKKCGVARVPSSNSARSPLSCRLVESVASAAQPARGVAEPRGLALARAAHRVLLMRLQLSMCARGNETIAGAASATSRNEAIAYAIGTL